MFFLPVSLVSVGMYGHLITLIPSFTFLYISPTTVPGVY